MTDKKDPKKRKRLTHEEIAQRTLDALLLIQLKLDSLESIEGTVDSLETRLSELEVAVRDLEMSVRRVLADQQGNPRTPRGAA